MSANLSGKRLVGDRVVFIINVVTKTLLLFVECGVGVIEVSVEVLCELARLDIVPTQPH